MFVISNFVISVAQLLGFVLTVYMWIVIGRVVVSWVSADPRNPVVVFLYAATEPVFSFLRRFLPLRFLGLDFAPMVLLLIIMFLQGFLVQTLKEIAVRM